MNEPFQITGGARVGGVNATWPMATLTASAEGLRLSVWLLGNFVFTPDMVVSITRYSKIPVLGWGIRIQHRVPEYPEWLVFWCFGNPDKLLAGIREAGFVPGQAAGSAASGPGPVPAPARRGLPVRWQALVAAVVVWNGLFLMMDAILHDRRLFTAGPMSTSMAVLPLGVTFFTCLALLRWPAFQRGVLKPGRHVGEIRPFLHLLLLVTGILGAVFTVIALVSG